MMHSRRNDDEKSNNAVMRAKLGPGSYSPDQNYDVVSLPSEVSENQWAEVPKYQAYKEQEIKKKEKENFLQKRSMVKATLDKQIRDQQEFK
jgi:hypothetical protein